MSKRSVLLVAAALTLASLSVEAFRQQKPSAVLTGTLLSDDGRPVDRAAVSIVGVDKPGVRATETNASGEFSFDGLPAGSFTLWSTKAGFLTSFYGSKDPGRGPATPVTLASGQRVAVSMTMRRGAGIGGKITDPAGQPLSEVLVQLRPASSPETAAPQTSKTDSEGHYLIFGLTPGDYIVEALPPQVQGRPLVYAPTFFPSVTVIDQAVNITVSAGEQRDDVSFGLYRAAKVSGKVVVPNGQPMSGVSIALVPSDAAAKPALPVSETGEFSFSGVIPGTYALLARGDTSSSARTAGPDGGTLWGEDKVVVNGPDVSGVVLSLRPGTRVSGTIRLDPPSRTPAMETVKLTLSPQISGTAALVGSLVATPDPAGSFVFPSVPPGPYDLRTAPTAATGSSADTSVITSAIASGHDVADGALDLRSGEAMSGVVVTLTETEISGIALDEASQPTARLSLVVFSVDRTFWTPRSRRVRTAQPAADGTFRIGGLPPGEYFVAASPNIDARVDAPVDAAYLDQFAAVASKVSIASGEKRRLDLTLGRQPDAGAASGGLAAFSGIWTTASSVRPNVGYEGLANSPAGQLQVGPGTGRIVISQRGDKLRVESNYAPWRNTMEYEMSGEPVKNLFFLGTTLPASPTPPCEVTSWRQGTSVVSTIDVFLPGESVPRHYVETMSLSPEGILAVRIERVGFPDTRTMFYQKAK